MIEEQPGADWRDLRQRVAAILSECGLFSEVEKGFALWGGELHFHRRPLRRE